MQAYDHSTISRQSAGSPQNSKRQAARDQERLGRSVIPQKPAYEKNDRIPLVKWAPYQTKRASAAQLAEWWNTWPNANPLIVTGAISDLVAIDIDDQAGLDWLHEMGIPDTFTVSRGAPGRCHLWFKYPGFHVSNTTIHEGVEIKGDGGTIPAPGAAHWSGAPYQVVKNAPLAELPTWLCDLLRPVERKPVERKPLPRGITDKARAYAMAALDHECNDLAGTSSHRNDQLFRAAAALASFPHGLLTDTEIESGLLPVAVGIGLIEKAARATIASGIKHGKANPRDLPDFDTPFKRQENGIALPLTAVSCNPTVSLWPGREHASSAESRAIYTHLSKVSLGKLVQLLCSDEPIRALDTMPTETRSRATTYRRRSFLINIPIKEEDPDQTPDSDQGVIKSETPLSSSQIRVNRLRVLFPQSGNKEIAAILIPISELSPEFFDQALSDEDLDQLRDTEVARKLTRNQRQAVTARLRTLARVEKIEKELGDEPFILPNRPIANLPDLRRHVLRQICARYTDPKTGESQLSNQVQACTLGVTPGALPGIRERGCIQQTANETVDHKQTNAARLPGNTLYVKIRDTEGNVKAFHRPTDPGILDTVSKAMRDGYDVITILQPVARQRVLPLVERQKPRPGELSGTVVLDTDDDAADEKPAQIATRRKVPNAPVKPKRQRRRSTHEQYAACLMRNILHHFQVPASADEPLDDLAAKLRRATSADVTTWIERSDPDRAVDELPDDLLSDQQPEPAASGCRQTVADILADLETVKELTERMDQIRKSRAA